MSLILARNGFSSSHLSLVDSLKLEPRVLFGVWDVGCGVQGVFH